MVGFDSDGSSAAGEPPEAAVLLVVAQYDAVAFVWGVVVEWEGCQIGLDGAQAPGGDRRDGGVGCEMPRGDVLLEGGVG